MKLRNLLVASLLSFSTLAGFAASASFAQADSGGETSSESAAVSPDFMGAINAIDEFCEGRENLPQPGIQFDGQAASPAVLDLAQGIYTYPNQGILISVLGRYVLQLPTDRQGIYGTDGDDYIVGSGVVAGCSAEQLSEAIANNNLILDDFQLIRAYEEATEESRNL